MAFYRLEVKNISRGGGGNAVASAAYRSGEAIECGRDGVTHDYTRKSDVIHTAILAPNGAGEWVYNRSKLHNAVEDCENRKDARLLKEIILTLPRELNSAQHIDLVRGFIQEQCVALGMVADIAIHEGKAIDGKPQPHAHVLLTTRPLDGEGFSSKKDRNWNKRELIEAWRPAWEKAANDALANAGSTARIDARTLKEQGIMREPEKPLGKARHMKRLYPEQQEQVQTVLRQRLQRAATPTRKQVTIARRALSASGHTIGRRDRAFDLENLPKTYGWEMER